MARRFLIVFYSIAIVVFVGIALSLAVESVVWFVRDRVDVWLRSGGPWLALLLIPVWLNLAWTARNLLKRKIAGDNAV